MNLKLEEKENKKIVGIFPGVIEEVKNNIRDLATMQHITKKIELVLEEYAKLTDKGRRMTEDSYNKKLEELENQKIDLQMQIDRIEEQIIDPDKMNMSLDEFLNLANSAADKMKVGLSVQKDELCRILFLNLTFDHEKGATFLWKEPFSMLINSRFVNTGGDIWT